MFQLLHYKNSISRRISLILALILAGATAIILIMITSQTIHYATKVAENESAKVAENCGRTVQILLSDALDQASATARSFSAGIVSEPLSWSYQSQVMKQLLSENEKFYSVYTYWDGGKFRGSFGTDSVAATQHTSPWFTEIWWIRDTASSVALMDMTEHDRSNPFLQKEWWSSPISTKKPALIDPYFDSDVGVLMVSATAPIVQNGIASGLVGIDLALKKIQEMADSIQLFEGKGKLLIASRHQTICALTGGVTPKELKTNNEPEFVMPKVSDLFPVSTEHFDSLLLGNKTVTEWWGNDLAVIVPLAFHESGTNWASVVLIPKSAVYASATIQTAIMITAMIIASILIILLIGKVIRKIIYPLVRVSEACYHIAQGKTDIEMHPEDLARTDEIGGLARGFQMVTDSLRSKIIAAQEIAAGKLDTSIELTSEDDQLGIALTEMRSSLSELVDGIIRSSSGVFKQVRNTMKHESMRLSQMELITHQTNSEVELCRVQMDELTTAMDEITVSSDQMAKIIKTIDEIAFQTNLLALNAAVEAARVGDHGKGFAVVADEVRNLASRSSKAARETQELIERDRSLVRQGHALTTSAATSLTGIVGRVDEVTQLVTTGALDAREKVQSMDEITRSLGHHDHDDYTEHSIAHSHDTIIALRSETSNLKNLVSRFN